jgi:hypothetical protein
VHIDPETTSRLLVEYWKLLRAYERTTGDLPANKAEKVLAQLRYSAHRLQQILERSDIKLVCFDGEEFSAELPVSAINADDVAGSETPIIDKTVEPTVIQSGTVFHTGKVLLRGTS